MFTWGQDTGGCLGTGQLNRLGPVPQIVEIEEEVSRVFCGPAATALLTPEGRLLVAGRNRGNMLGLDNEKSKVKQSDQFLGVMEEPVEEVGLSEVAMVLLTRAGQLFVLGGESRVPTKLNLSSPGKPVLVAASSTDFLVAMEEGPVIQVQKRSIWSGFFLLYFQGEVGRKRQAGASDSLGGAWLSGEGGLEFGF